MILPTTTTSESSTSLLTSVPIIGTVSSSVPFYPSTILVQPTSSSTPTNLVPTATAALPSGLPKAITPDNGNSTLPADTQVIQIAFLAGLNYNWVAAKPQAAAQIVDTLPAILSYHAGCDPSMVKVTTLMPYNTFGQVGYYTTLALTTYPKNLVAQLRMDMHLPNSAVFQNPNALAYNMSQQINTAIDILLGSTLDAPATGTGGPAATSTGNPDMFNNAGNQNQTPTQKGVTAAIALGTVAVSVAYGTAMFVVARRYKRRKQSHHRSSSVTNPSEMRQTGTGSPALMGGALLSRDFTSSFAGVPAAPGGRDSHGSGRSGMGNSARTAFISAPVAAENSLGWN